MASSVLDALADALEAEYDAFVDRRRLRTGDPWRQELLVNAQTCDAGVVLLCENALASSWVLIECSIMMARWTGGDGFVFLPVRLGDVTSDEIRSSELGHLHLSDEVQLARGNSPGEVVDIVLAGLAPVRERTGRGRSLYSLESRVAALLARIAAGDAAERALADALGVEWRTWHPEGLTTALARAVFDRDVPLDALARGLAQLGQPAPDRTEICDLAIPFKTVPETAADSLRAIISTTPGGAPGGNAAGGNEETATGRRRAAVMRGTRDRVADWYLRRAAARFPALDPVMPTATPQPGQYDEDVTEEITGEILTRLGFLPGEEPRDGEVEAALEDYEGQRGEPVVVVLSRAFDGPLVDRLRGRHPRVVFLLMTTSPQPEELRLDDVEVLRPLIDSAAERTYHRRYSQMTGVT